MLRQAALFARGLVTRGLPALVALCLTAAPGTVRAGEAPVKIVAFGDSLTAGLGLSENEAFPAKLAAALKGKGYAVVITNAGVSGDTTTGALARLDWSVPEGTDGVIMEFGANDAFRGIPPARIKANLDTMIRRLQARGVSVLLAGMRAPRNMGADYIAGFDAVFPALAAAHGLVFYPFFLEGVATDPALNQGDGLHPNDKGVAAIVAGILPKAEELIARIKAKQGS